MKKINIMCLLILLFNLFCSKKVSANVRFYSQEKDSCYLRVDKTDSLIIGNRKFVPIYLNYYQNDLLGWFHFSTNEILYLSPVYKSSTLIFKKANKIQVLFSKKNKKKNRKIYYFGNFSHCKISFISGIDDYQLKVNWLMPPPSHADILEQIVFSKNLSLMKLEASFIGGKSQICQLFLSQ